MAATWRQLAPSDIEGLLSVAGEVHPGLPERGDVFRERVKLFPEGCLALVQDSTLYGYAISHPIRRGHPPPLDSLLGEIAPDADQYYIHDMAILPAARKKGHAADVILRLLQIAQRYPTSCLISVYGTAPFWARFGFHPAEPAEVAPAKLQDYGDDATHLVRRND